MLCQYYVNVLSKFCQSFVKVVPKLSLSCIHVVPCGANVLSMQFLKMVLVGLQVVPSDAFIEDRCDLKKWCWWISNRSGCL